MGDVYRYVLTVYVTNEVPCILVGSDLLQTLLSQTKHFLAISKH